MNRGFALVTVLWLVVALAGLLSLAGGTLALARPTAENRLGAVRSVWAARACVEIFRARFAVDTSFSALDSVSLAPDSWCSARSSSPSVRLSIDRADDETVSRLIGDDSLVAAILDWRDPDNDARANGAERSWYQERGLPGPHNRPFSRMSELLLVRGVTPEVLTVLERAITVGGDGRLDPNRAPESVLASIGDLPDGGAAALVRLRAGGATFRTSRDVSDALAAEGFGLNIERMRALDRRFVFPSGPEALSADGVVLGARGRLVSALLIPVRLQEARITVLREDVR